MKKFLSAGNIFFIVFLFAIAISSYEEYKNPPPEKPKPEKKQSQRVMV